MNNGAPIRGKSADNDVAEELLALLQRRSLQEADFRGREFRRHAKDLRGNFDVLNLAQPEIVGDVHRQYFEAGADIVETNTFNCNAISLAEYGLESRAADLAFAGAQIARRAADQFSSAHVARRCFVAGSMGPTPRTASVSQDVGNPAARGVTFDQLRTAYATQAQALVEGGVDLLLM